MLLKTAFLIKTDCPSCIWGRVWFWIILWCTVLMVEKPSCHCALKPKVNQGQVSQIASIKSVMQWFEICCFRGWNTHICPYTCLFPPVYLWVFPVTPGQLADLISPINPQTIIELLSCSLCQVNLENEAPRIHPHFPQIFKTLSWMASQGILQKFGFVFCLTLGSFVFIFNGGKFEGWELHRS